MTDKKTLTEIFKDIVPVEFKPFMYYCEDGDSIEVVMTEEMSRTESLSPYLDIHRGAETGDITGFIVHGVFSLIASEEKIRYLNMFKEGL